MKHKKSPAELANATRKKTYSKIEDGIMIFDCTFKSEEQCSEGEFLEQYIKILNHQLEARGKEPVYLYFRHVRSPTKSPDSLKVRLKYPYTYTLHISAHGGLNEDAGQTVLQVGKGLFTLEDLKGLWEDIPENERPLLIVLSACQAGHLDLIRALSQEGCRYCIAPVFETDWEKAALFSALFYTYLFCEQMRPVAAFQKAKSRLPELTGWWKMFDNGKEI